MRKRAQKYLICSAIIALCGVVLSYGTVSQPEAAAQISSNNSANEEIISMYNELIALRQHAVEENRKLWQLGQGNLPEVVDDEIKLAEARIQLAQFQSKRETVVKELQNLVQTMTEMRNTIRLEVELGQRPRSYIYDLDARLLETKIRLAKVKVE
jgi:hypothetical protein